MTSQKFALRIQQHIAEIRAQALATLAGRIIAVASDKGGIGKTTIAVEVAFCLGAVLIDADWQDGNSSRSLGVRHEERVKTPLLAALDSGRTPRPIKGAPSKPDLVASGPDLEDQQPPPGVFGAALVQWATQWNRPVVVDTHPGGGRAANDACAEAHALLVPAPLMQKDLRALDGWAKTMAGYRMMLVPNKVQRNPPMAETDWLEHIASRENLPVATPVPLTPFLDTRKARTAVCSTTRPGQAVRPFISSTVEVAREVMAYAAAA